MATTDPYHGSMTTTTTHNSSLHVHSMDKFSVEFSKLPNTKAIMARVSFGSSAALTFFFDTDADAETFAREMWLGWTDYIAPEVRAELEEMVAGA